jgi:hypothetical protein
MWKKILAWLLKFLEPKPVPPVTPPAPVDAIDINSVIFDLPFDTSANITATLSDVKITLPQTLDWVWTHPEWVRWAGGTQSPFGVIGTMWVMFFINGSWHAAGWEWLLSETCRSTTEALDGEPPFIQTKSWPTNAHRPVSGERVGFMVSTISPGWDGPPPSLQPPERSPIVCAIWP